MAKFLTDRPTVGRQSSVVSRQSSVVSRQSSHSLIIVHFRPLSLWPSLCCLLSAALSLLRLTLLRLCCVVSCLVVSSPLTVRRRSSNCCCRRNVATHFPLSTFHFPLCSQSPSQFAVHSLIDCHCLCLFLCLSACRLSTRFEAVAVSQSQSFVGRLCACFGQF